ncbi:MAG: aminotransferase class V-fold PLP-dependent enzyme [Cytophagales bacterium]|nr:aminotransferase class V-fold PLP-dependent enzyme [Bernardetiaceae bacterium]MDW8205117.1 aminotransferase class V-fold PLP-dependent enzyme [Cytophagales bacterium]
MYFFYPGPAKLHALVPQWTAEIFAEGLTSRNHRSPEIIHCYQRAAEGLRLKLHIPSDYAILFTSSATECWEILGQSFFGNRFMHIFNGSFGEKWAKVNQKLGNPTHALRYSYNDLLPLNNLPASEWICLTHCETSNGTYIANELLLAAKELYPERLLALDATSSLGGICIPWQATDYVFASVQKCLGLPSGMAVLVCSPRATTLALQLAHTTHYNSLANSLPLAAQYQTTHTPNILGMALLMKLTAHIPPVNETDCTLRQRARWWYQWLENNGFDLLVGNAATRSPTVITLQAPAEKIATLKKQATLNGFVLGNGYGEWKDTTLRIANFPAITDQEVLALQKFLLTFHPSK